MKRKHRATYKHLTAVGKYLRPGQIILSVITIAIVVAAGNAVSNHAKNDNSDSSPEISEAIPSIQKVAGTGANSGWILYKDQQDGFNLSLPKAWQYKPVPSGDPDDGYYLTFSNPGPPIAEGFLSVTSDEWGRGTPGPLVSSENVTLPSVNAKKLIWESATERLVQYRFNHDSKHFLLQLQSDKTDVKDFSVLDEVARRFSFL